MLAASDAQLVTLPASGGANHVWAETIGCRVPRVSGRGQVGGLFEKACHVMLDCGRLIAVLAPQAGNVAHGIRLDRSLPFASMTQRGMPVRVADDRVVFGEERLTVRLSRARVWTPELRSGVGEWNDRARIAAQFVRELLLDCALRGHSEFLAASLRLPRPVTPLANRVLSVLPRLAAAVRSRDDAAASDALAVLIGLGPGLTPAGDDFIIGFLAGLTLSATGLEQHAFLQLLCARVEDLASRTTIVSREHLHDATASMFSERLSDLCIAIARSAPRSSLASLVAAQVAVGASSGADAAAGLIFALFDCDALQPGRALH
jgi:hypothetical protein